MLVAFRVCGFKKYTRNNVGCYLRLWVQKIYPRRCLLLFVSAGSKKCTRGQSWMVVCEVLLWHVIGCIIIYSWPWKSGVWRWKTVRMLQNNLAMKDIFSKILYLCVSQTVKQYNHGWAVSVVVYWARESYRYAIREVPSVECCIYCAWVGNQSFAYAAVCYWQEEALVWAHAGHWTPFTWSWWGIAQGAHWIDF